MGKLSEIACDAFAVGTPVVDVLRSFGRQLAFEQGEEDTFCHTDTINDLQSDLHSLDGKQTPYGALIDQSEPTETGQDGHVAIRYINPLALL